MTRAVKVDLGSRSYDIHIGNGLLEQAGTQIAKLRAKARCAIVTDANLERLHGKTLRDSLTTAGLENTTIVVEPGEATKSMEWVGKVASAIIDARLERNDLILAFGGGVVGDLAGFAAAITRRGMDFVQIPTSLLAQVDSSVGGKTGVNVPQGKNLIGAFHQPSLVIADTELLSTLPKREFRAGYAEVVKYGLINRPDLFDWLESNRRAIFSADEALSQAIAMSCEAKARIVAEDERESGARALLNLGHTFGHALEAATAYDSARLIHGEGVAIGLCLAHEFSNRLNLCDVETASRVSSHLRDAGLPTQISDIPGELPDAARLCDFIAQDKKVHRGQLTFVLTKGIGKAYIADNISSDLVRSFLEEKLTT